MAPVNYNHFDGYSEGPEMLTKYRPGETIPGMNAGGWRDAGDDDLRIKSQADEVSIPTWAYESFGLDYDDRRWTRRTGSQGSINPIASRTFCSRSSTEY